jgi:uncharacterized membrane protein
MAKFIDKIVNYFTSDKVLHFLVGALIVAQFEVFAANPSGWFWPFIGVILVAVLSFLKEKYLDDEFDLKDIWAALAGAFIEVWLLIIRMWFFSDVPFGGFNL